MENITDAYNKPTKQVWRNFELKNLGDYHDLYVQNDTLLLADVFENFREKLAWQACLKKTEAKLDLSTDIDMLEIVKKEIRSGICHAIYQYAKVNNKYTIINYYIYNI